MEIKSVDDFKKLVQQVQGERLAGVMGQEELRYEYFRGHSKDTYKLTPSIARGVKNSDDLRELEKKYFKEFKEGLQRIGKQSLFRESNDKNNDNYKYFMDWEFMWQLQHYELPTRLLDWSLDPKIALYFSVIDDNFNGHLWVLRIPMNFYEPQNEYLDFSPENYLKSKLINPYFNDENDFNSQIGELRRMRQHGKFFYQDFENSLIPMEEQENLKEYLTKYIIPKDSKNIFREYLKKEKYTKELLLAKIDKGVVELINKIKNPPVVG